MKELGAMRLQLTGDERKALLFVCASVMPTVAREYWRTNEAFFALVDDMQLDDLEQVVHGIAMRLAEKAEEAAEA